MSATVDAVILAGGRATRMGGEDKGLVLVNQKPLIQFVIDRIQPQVKQIIINANRNQQAYQAFGLPVITDSNMDFNGPLAGVVQAMGETKADYLVTAPCDCPNLPSNLVLNMLNAITKEQADIAVASDGENLHPVVMLLKPSLRPSLQEFLNRGDRKIILWYKQHKTITVPFNGQEQAFININTPEQIQQFSTSELCYQ